MNKYAVMLMVLFSACRSTDKESQPKIISASESGNLGWLIYLHSNQKDLCFSHCVSNSPNFYGSPPKDLNCQSSESISSAKLEEIEPGLFSAIKQKSIYRLGAEDQDEGRLYKQQGELIASLKRFATPNDSCLAALNLGSLESFVSLGSLTDKDLSVSGEQMICTAYYDATFHGKLFMRSSQKEAMTECRQYAGPQNIDKCRSFACFASVEKIQPKKLGNFRTSGFSLPFSFAFRRKSDLKIVTPFGEEAKFFEDSTP